MSEPYVSIPVEEFERLASQAREADALRERAEAAEARVAIAEHHEQLARSDEAKAEALADALREQVAEWKREAELSKWPKEAAQEYRKLQSEVPALREQVEAARVANDEAWNLANDKRLASGEVFQAVNRVRAALARLDQQETPEPECGAPQAAWACQVETHRPCWCRGLPIDQQETGE